MIFCAPSVCPLLTSVLICSFCWSVKVTPDGPSALMPLTGSLSALPSCFDAGPCLPNPAADRSAAACVARSKIVVALADLVADVLERQQHVGAGLDRLVVDAGLVADRRRQVADLPAVIFAAPPVDLMIWVVCAPTFCASRASVHIFEPYRLPASTPARSICGPACFWMAAPRPLAEGKIEMKADPISAKASHLRVYSVAWCRSLKARALARIRSCRS
jgi:hypothetical protein